MNQNAPQHFFISYNKADRTWAEWIAWHLEEAGYTTIIQAWDFRPGMNFVQKMHEAAQEAERTIAVLSTNYLEALYTYPEWEAALQQDPRGEKGVLVPVRFQECKPPGLLGLLSYIDLVGLDESAAQERLLEGVRHERNKPPTAPLFPGTLHEAQRNVSEQPGFPGAFPPIWNVPYARNPYFTGRDTILHQLHAALSKDSATAITQGQAIFGLGGIGKTQTAVEYTYRYRSEYRSIFWVRAETEVELQTGFGAIATLLDLPEQKATNPADTAQAIKHWLEHTGEWLLIFDNADTPELLKAYYPRTPKGHILLTSRAQNFDTLGIDSTYALEKMDSEEALDFLFKRTARAQNDPVEKNAAEHLARELGYLPLALEQAAAYIRAKGALFQAYLSSYQRQRLSLLNKADPKTGNYPTSVAMTWALIRLDVETQTYSIHRMVQEVLKDQMGREQQAQWAEQVVRAVAQSFPEVNYQTLTRCERLIPHALVCAAHIEHWKMTFGEARNLLFLTGQYLYQRGQYWEAEPLWKSVLAICAQALGPEQPDTLSALNNLALLYWEQGKYEEAEPLYQRALPIYEQALGADHPETKRARNNYAHLQEKMKQNPEVEHSKPKPARKRGGK